MLPRLLYELLPYLYLSIGLSTGLIFDSSVIFVAATLLISTGIMVLFMRFNYRRNIRRMLTDRQLRFELDGQHQDGVNIIELHGSGFVKRSSKDRRQKTASEFPLVDSLGNLVMGDRRVGDRRLNSV